MRLLIFFNNIVRYDRHVVTKVGLSYCISRREMGAIGLTDKAEGTGWLRLKVGCSKLKY